MNASQLFRRAICLLGMVMAAGCIQTVVYPRRDAGGGMLTDSFACVYDSDSRGLWYVIFVRRDGLLAAVHRHDPGFHLFVYHNDLLFYSRCSGRGEVLDVMGETFHLSKGAVFLCEIEQGTPLVRQLNLAAPACDADQPADVAKTLLDLSQNPAVAGFIPAEAKARWYSEWKEAKKSAATPRAGNS